MKTQVVIIGAEVSGADPGNLPAKVRHRLRGNGRRDRAYIEQRQRAGVVDARAVRIFQEWGLTSGFSGWNYFKCG